MLRFPILISIAAGVGALVWRGLEWDPRHSALFPPCPFHLLTGFYCPGCGSTRAAHALIHGHLVAACKWNGLMVASLVIVMMLVIQEAFALKGNQQVPRTWIQTYLVVVILFWVLRNMPCYPFCLLAPHS